MDSHRISLPSIQSMLEPPVPHRVETIGPANGLATVNQGQRMHTRSMSDSQHDRLVRRHTHSQVTTSSPQPPVRIRQDLQTNTGSTKPQQRYRCSTCTKTFSRPSSLRVHVYSHTGEKPHVCPHPGCDRRFSVQSNMRRHLRVHYCNSFQTPVHTDDEEDTKGLQPRSLTGSVMPVMPFMRSDLRPMRDNETSNWL